MVMLGSRIAALCPDCRVLVLSNPYAEQAGYLNEKRQYERAGIRGLAKGLGGRQSVIVAFPKIRPEYASDPQFAAIPPDSRTPLSFLIQGESVDELAGAHPECRVIVSLIGLPVGVEDLKVWDAKDRRCFALLLPDLRVLGPPERAVEAFQRGKLLVLVTEDSRSGKPMVVARDNVGEVLQSDPKSLGY